jgi:hypothetical protein
MNTKTVILLAVGLGFIAYIMGNYEKNKALSSFGQIVQLAKKNKGPRSLTKSDYDNLLKKNPKNNIKTKMNMEELLAFYDELKQSKETKKKSIKDLYINKKTY